MPSFWEKNPHIDGRGVVVGVIDDGLSPHALGFRKTTTGERKVIGHDANSTGLRFQLQPVKLDTESNPESDINENNNENGVIRSWTGLIDEEKPLLSRPYRFNDLNRNTKKDQIKVWVFEKENQALKICIDTNMNLEKEKNECFAPFNETGEYGLG